MRASLSSQSVRKRTSRGGKANGRLHHGWANAAMPLMSPARMPGASSFRSVLPPRTKKLPSRILLAGVAAR